MRVLLVAICIIIIGCHSDSKDQEVRNQDQKNKDEKVNTLTEINSLWNYSDPVSTRDKFKKLLTEVQGEADLDYILQLKTQIARTHSLKSEFNEAHKILDEVNSKINSDTKIAKIRYFLERGRTYNSSNDKDNALKTFKEALRVANENNHLAYGVDAIHMLAIAAPTFNEKLKWTEEGQALAAKSNDPKVNRWVGVFLNNAGWDLFSEKRYQEALNKFIECKSYYEKVDDNKRFDIARWSISKTHRFLGNTDKAFEIMNSLLTENNGEDPSGYTFEEMGELYLLKGDKEKAKSFFSKAYSILSKDQWLMTNEPERMERMKSFAE